MTRDTESVLRKTNVFPYPGGKSYLAPWIIDHIPDHDCYVEPFAGSAAVLTRKPESKVEVVNDRDGDITQFLITLRDNPTELREWVETTPYSRDLHRKYANAYYSGYRPDDAVERAGRFFYLRYSQFAGKYRTKSGFRSGSTRNKAETLNRAASHLDAFAERLQSVQIENRDYATVFDRFDGPRTVFYCDPPYVDEGDALYSGEEFNHQRFVSELESLEGEWLVSYTKLPDGLSDHHVVAKSQAQRMSDAHDDAKKQRVERLVCSFDPEQATMFAGSNQATLTGAQP
jgi:DNA adenine methylase